MTTMIAVILAACLMLAGGSHAQPLAVISNAGYRASYRDYPNLAPGQIVTLFVHGIQRDFKDRVIARTSPLPTSLEGISVRTSGGLAPVLALEKEQSCNEPYFAQPICADAIAITVQLPFELRVPIQPILFDGLAIYDNGTLAAALAYSSAHTSPHVLAGLDNLSLLLNLGGGLFLQNARRQDGSLARDAKPGEPLWVYAVGLGWRQLPGPKPATGQAAAADYELPRGWVGIDYQWGRDLPPRRVPVSPETRLPVTDGLLWAGIPAGQTGIYRIDFRVPEVVPDNLDPCGIQGNLTVSFGAPLRGWRRGDTYDGVSVCVQPPANTGSRP